MVGSSGSGSKILFEMPASPRERARPCFAFGKIGASYISGARPFADIGRDDAAGLIGDLSGSGFTGIAGTALSICFYAFPDANRFARSLETP